MKTKLVLGTTLLVLGGAAVAQVPSIISYQGRVQASGTNFSGTGQFKFALVSPGTNVSRQATATATVTAGFVTGIAVTDGGGGYASAPAVTIADSTGTGAAAVAQVSGGVVTNIAIQNAGSGYSSSPTVGIAPPPVTIVHGTFWSNDGSSSAGSEPASAVPVPVQQGLFTVFLGDTNLPNMQPVAATVFNQEDVRLRIWFSNGTSGFAQLSPDQRLGSVGYAMKAAFVSEGGVSGAALATGAVTSVTIENGSILVEDLSANLLNGAFWNLSGNSGTAPGTHFLGTTDNQPLEFKVHGTRALRLEPNASNGAVNVIGGSAENFVSLGASGVTIGGGGGSNAFFGIMYTNSVSSDFGTVGGGNGNTIGSDAVSSAIGGGRNNNIVGNGSEWSTISGGRNNDIDAFCNSASIGGGDNNNIARGGFGGTIAGGRDNAIGTGDGLSGGLSSIGGGTGNDIGGSQSATIGGGNGNSIGTGSFGSTIGGGIGNTIPNSSRAATIPGGEANFATNRAFAAGTDAKALHTGAFVWADYRFSTFPSVASTNDNSVTMRASGGYRFFSNSGSTVGAYLAPGGGSWTSMSDRNAKENLVPVDARGVLDKVAALPVSIWNYKSQTNGVRHIGPMAQDFKAAFGVGETDTGITTLDADGVALAAIQGLNQKVEDEVKRSREKDAEIQSLKEELAAIKQALLKITNQKDEL